MNQQFRFLFLKENVCWELEKHVSAIWKSVLSKLRKKRISNTLRWMGGGGHRIAGIGRWHCLDITCTIKKRDWQCKKNVQTREKSKPTHIHTERNCHGCRRYDQKKFPASFVHKHTSDSSGQNLNYTDDDGANVIGEVCSWVLQWRWRSAFCALCDCLIWKWLLCKYIWITIHMCVCVCPCMCRKRVEKREGGKDKQREAKRMVKRGNERQAERKVEIEN